MNTTTPKHLKTSHLLFVNTFSYHNNIADEEAFFHKNKAPSCLCSGASVPFFNAIYLA